MTTNHIDQLAQWWENAEDGLPSAGDTLIWRKPDSSYEVFTAGATDDALGNHIRILARAPEPKPAWHDAVAVIAHTDKNGRQVWERCMGHWDGTAGDEALDSDLRDVTPLIEAKVTDEMVDRARNYMRINTGQTHTHNVIRGVITTALGLDPA